MVAPIIQNQVQLGSISQLGSGFIASPVNGTSKVFPTFGAARDYLTAAAAPGTPVKCVAGNLNTTEVYAVFYGAFNPGYLPASTLAVWLAGNTGSIIGSPAVTAWTSTAPAYPGIAAVPHDPVTDPTVDLSTMTSPSVASTVSGRYLTLPVVLPNVFTIMMSIRMSSTKAGTILGSLNTSNTPLEPHPQFALYLDSGGTPHVYSYGSPSPIFNGTAPFGTGNVIVQINCYAGGAIYVTNDAAINQTVVVPNVNVPPGAIGGASGRIGLFCGSSTGGFWQGNIGNLILVRDRVMTFTEATNTYAYLRALNP